MKIIRWSLSFSLLLLTTSLFADEGMWMLQTLSDSSKVRMQALGCDLSPKYLYSEDQPSLKDAVVIFGGGCTGITVSDQGLIFTNHHCGYDAIQSQSSLEHDYLKDGFVAPALTDELPIPGLEVRYLIRTQNLTQEILAVAGDMDDEYFRQQRIDSFINIWQDSIKNGYNDEFIDVRIVPYFDHNEYHLNVYKRYVDVRMVLAPPSSIGKFGGDTDNWMWPRHTGDFSIFRVYANADNEPARYDAANVPYRPRQFALIAGAGYREHDYCMTIGYPGRTDRYLSSWGVRQRVKNLNAPRIEVRGIKQSIWKEAMLESDQIRIQYASKYARSSNYWKNSIGMNRGIDKMHVITRKQALENQFENWCNASPGRREEYGTALDLIRQGYTESEEMQQAYTYLNESFARGAEIIQLASIVMGYDLTQSEEDRSLYLRNLILPLYKDYNASVDEKVLAAMMKIVIQRVPADLLPPYFSWIEKKYKGDYEKYAEDIFKKSVIPYPDKLEKVLSSEKKVRKLHQDPAYQLAIAAREATDAARVGLNTYRYDVLKGERLFFAGLREMMPEKNFSPDANSTMRMSYGTIAGYQPFDGAWYDYYTTSEGVFEKYDPKDPDFDVQQDILQLLGKREFDRYANENGDLVLCFLSDNDITGGNSGSPMFDAKGRIIGLAFDGNWEAMSGDIAFEPDVQRTIGVDIRYVLFLIEKWGKCNRLIEELKIEN